MRELNRMDKARQKIRDFEGGRGRNFFIPNTRNLFKIFSLFNLSPFLNNLNNEFNNLGKMHAFVSKNMYNRDIYKSSLLKFYAYILN